MVVAAAAAVAAAMGKQLGDMHGCHNVVIALNEFFVWCLYSIPPSLPHKPLPPPPPPPHSPSHRRSGFRWLSLWIASSTQSGVHVTVIPPVTFTTTTQSGGDNKAPREHDADSPIQVM